MNIWMNEWIKSITEPILLNYANSDQFEWILLLLFLKFTTNWINYYYYDFHCCSCSCAPEKSTHQSSQLRPVSDVIKNPKRFNFQQFYKMSDTTILNGRLWIPSCILGYNSCGNKSRMSICWAYSKSEKLSGIGRLGKFIDSDLN